MGAAAYFPDSLVNFAQFLRKELAPFPWRINIALRCTLASAIVIVTSMTLEVPALALSLICVFYVTQSNVVITRLAGALFIGGATLALGIFLLLSMFMFDYPLLRITAASLVFFISVYLMRILKVGVMFFIVAIVVIYLQSLIDQISVPDLMVRLILWVWVVVTYAIVITLLVNTWLLPVEPLQQLKEEIHRQLAMVSAELARLERGAERQLAIDPNEFLAGMLTLQKLLKFAAMRDEQSHADEAYQLGLIATVSRLYRAAGELPAAMPAPSPAQIVALMQLRSECTALDTAVQAGERFRVSGIPPQHSEDTGIPGIVHMQRALHALADFGRQAAPLAAQQQQADPMVVPDAFSNPVYARFSLKTLLAVLIGYVFYNSVQWQGVHTVMLTCLIVALPGLGASTQKAVLRIGGALAGSALALFMVVFVIPKIDGIVGLLLMTLPVIALGAWITAGSERISYAGIQVMFTFALALLENFGPTTDLTEIRDRIVGILLGVGLSVAIQTLIWPEGEADALRKKLAHLLRSTGAFFRGHAYNGGAPDQLPYVQQHMRAWTELGTTQAMLARVALEPDWKEGENEMAILRTQTVLSAVREILVAADALHGQLVMSDAQDPALRGTVQAMQIRIAESLEQYAKALEENPPNARRPAAIVVATPSPLSDEQKATERFEPVLATAQGLLRQLGGLPDWQQSSPEPVIMRESLPQ